MRKKDRNPVSDTFNIWAAFTDLMSNAFLVITLLLLLVISSAATHNSSPNSSNNDKSAIVTISGKEYKFASASADLPENLQEALISGKSALAEANLYSFPESTLHFQIGSAM